MEKEKDAEGYPSICEVIEILGAKWSFLIIAELNKGPRRFQQLQRDLSVVRTQSLTNALRQLEKNGLVHREVFPTVPVTVEYSLTEKGADFQSALKEMENWAKRWRSVQT
ncbi:transcriptional regulator [Paenibacillus nanensis]|uniref:Transcriptional regulator n=1 Tax=Paenibacillus nanensis TaxID=393251 RepID=A0A3A1V067_9BACL|nr:helix-turn-helix domain-containing protein [Paenibacillus nanensis]RIX53924.1 transcriptional regulator [Paenibacillus nanensis]